MSIEENVQAFRTTLLFQLPFYGEIINHIPFQADPHIDTAQTDGLRVRYNPNFFKTLNRGQQNYVLMHEVMHILLRHSRRSGEKRPDLWNAACDMVVNTMIDSRIGVQIRATGLPCERPADGLFTDGRLGAWSAEQFYAELAKLNPEKRKTITIPVRSRYGQAPERLEKPVPDDLPSEAVQMENKDLLDGIIRQALANAQERTRGLGGSVFIPEQVIAFTIRKPLPWKVLLKNMLNEWEDDNDSSWATPERKYIHMDLLLPGRCRSEADALGEVWAFVDSSGSITRNAMAGFLNELWHLLHDFHCVMNIAYWDTSVTDVYRNIDSEKKLKDCIPRHSGGTDINCVYRYITENRLKPEVMLILTDGYFGQLKDLSPLRRLRDKTVMVLSTTIAQQPFKQYGRIASL